MTATFPLHRAGRPSKYKKPKERRQASAAKVRRVREALGDSQPEFAKRLTEMAIAAGHGNVTGVWTVIAWEQAKREPDAARMPLIDQLEREVEGRDGGGSV